MAERPNCKYTKDHEWMHLEGDAATVGITDFAQAELGDVVYIDLPSVGALVEKGKSMFTVESVKAVSDIYAPVDGEIIEVNDSLSSSPQLVNEDPFKGGWMVKIKASNTDTSHLLDVESYNAHVLQVSK